MIAVDTNLVVRLLVADSPEEVEHARHVVEKNIAWVSRTVVLETAWVLQHHYGHSITQTANILLGILESESFEVEDELLIADAVDLAKSGMDIADAIHLCCTPPDLLPFYSFDQKLFRIAKQLGYQVENPTSKSI